MEIVLNETTETVHKHKPEGAASETVCGATRHLDRDQLHLLPAEQAVTDRNTTKCGRCFEDGGSY